MECACYHKITTSPSRAPQQGSWHFHNSKPKRGASCNPSLTRRVMKITGHGPESRATPGVPSLERFLSVLQSSPNFATFCNLNKLIRWNIFQYLAFAGLGPKHLQFLDRFIAPQPQMDA